ncbi:MAG: hypothetical protein ACLFPO_11165 [Spirochaetaceae bacterium]
MELIGDFFVFFFVYGGLHYLFTERKRTDRDGYRRPPRTALLRSAGIAALAAALFVFFAEVIDLF